MCNARKKTEKKIIVTVLLFQGKLRISVGLLSQLKLFFFCYFLLWFQGKKMNRSLPLKLLRLFLFRFVIVAAEK